MDHEAFSNYTGKLIFNEVDDASKLPVPAWKPIWDQATQATVDGFHADSEKLFRECLRLALLAHGEEHTLVCQIHHNLGTTHQRMFQFDKAEEEYLKGLKLADNLVWKDAPLAHDVHVQLLEGLAALYNAQDRIREAEPVCMRSYQTSCEIFGEDSPKVVNSLRRLAALRERQGNLDMSLELLEKAYRIVASNISMNSTPGTKTRSATVSGELVELLVRMVHVIVCLAAPHCNGHSSRSSSIVPRSKLTPTSGSSSPWSSPQRWTLYVRGSSPWAACIEPSMTSSERSRCSKSAELFVYNSTVTSTSQWHR